MFGRSAGLFTKHHLKFKILIVLTGILILNCINPTEQTDQRINFSVLDVGQGTSQLIHCGTSAILVDIGPFEGYQSFLTAYTKAGSPKLEYIVISHSDLDHCGGLKAIDNSIDWSGDLVITTCEDTTYLKTLLRNWSKEVHFITIHENDTLYLEKDVFAHCLWPQDCYDDVLNSVSSSDKNGNSIVLKIVAGFTSAMITSDIDSTVQRDLISRYGTTLKADIIVANHHGSSDFLPLFYDFVDASYTVLSYGVGNSYNHPSARLLNYLYRTDTKIRETALNGSVWFESNLFYWVENK
jgi:competence protein ComEC